MRTSNFHAKLKDASFLEVLQVSGIQRAQPSSRFVGLPDSVPEAMRGYRPPFRHSIELFNDVFVREPSSLKQATCCFDHALQGVPGIRGHNLIATFFSPQLADAEGIWQFPMMAPVLVLAANYDPLIASPHALQGQASKNAVHCLEIVWHHICRESGGIVIVHAYHVHPAWATPSKSNRELRVKCT
jgi:hypothetical protein